MRKFLAVSFTILFIMSNAQASEPIVVLSYGGSSWSSGSEADHYNSHPFREDPNFHKSHKVMKNETLGEIMAEHYGGSGLNMKFVEIAILQFNRVAFVRGNPNFLYADKTLHLPSVNEINDLITGKKSIKKFPNGNGKRDEIFFFGG